jgi:two-component system phosphate regulon sensor histidine kinase PhoR
MKLNQHTIRVIIASSIVALLGLLILQFILLKNAYEYRQQAFERNVYAAMSSIAQKLETREAMKDVFRVALSAPGPSNKIMTVRVEGDSVNRTLVNDSLHLFKIEESVVKNTPVQIENNVIRYSVDSRQHVTLRVLDLTNQRDTLLVDGMKEAGDYLITCSTPDISNREIIIKYRDKNSSYTMHLLNGSFQGVLKDSAMLENRENIVGRVIQNLSRFEPEPIERRIRPALLDSVITRTLTDVGINLPVVYGIASKRDDSLRLVKPSGFGKELLSSGFRNSLFPNDFLFGSNQLLLYFPDQRVYLLKQVGLFLGLTVLFITMIVGSFIYTIKTLIRQQQFALRLGDFINNMTHEFKTPITTIAVATETIVRPDIIGQQDKVLRYGGVIQDEAVRMKKQVDKILQIAVLEEGDYELQQSDVDIHEIIQNAVNNITLQVEAKAGRIECRLDARHPIVRGDILHLANIIHNLLDNACKYSLDTPDISVTTSNINNTILIDIADHGIGMSKDDTAKVFEKYYRAHTGNIHDVKGFGLGLTYTKLMVEAFGGSVSLKSELGKGTTAHLIFPVIPEHHTPNE